LPRLSARLDVFLFAPCFTSGIVAYDLIKSKAWKRKLPSWTWPVGIAVITALFGPHDNINLYVKIQRAWTISLLLGLLYASVEDLPSNKLQKCFHWIAEHSYGIYLSHIVLIWLAVDRLAGSPVWIRVIVLVVGTIAIPALLYVSVEKPLIRVGSHVAARLLRSKVEKREPQLV
ncbi:MAG TPA: acyltransferase family protein, partial [Edaphobacter sp.]